MGILEQVSDQELEALYQSWELKARDKQIPPDGDWFVYLLRAGRGFGKTRSGAEWIHKRAMEKKRWMAIIGKTPGDVRDDCIEGPGGLKQNTPMGVEIDYQPSRRRITWENGSYATIYSGANPDQIRGFSGDTAWCDEFAAWDYPKKSWKNLTFGLREGEDPRAFITTTPKPLKALKEIEEMESCVLVTGSSYENKDNLSDRFFESVIEPAEGTTIGQQEIHAEYIESRGMWTWGMIEEARKDDTDTLPNMKKIAVAVDPAVTNTEKSDETGIVVCSKGSDGTFYVLEDCSLKASPSDWASAAVNAHHRHEADFVVAETNQGGDMVERMIRQSDPTIPYKQVKATRGKSVRAQPVVSLYERREVTHIKRFPDLESQLVGYGGEKTSNSPDRMDALVWGITHLMDQGEESSGIGGMLA